MRIYRSEKPKEVFKLSALPTEILLGVLIELDTLQILRFRRVCSVWKSLIDGDSLWKTKCVKIITDFKKPECKTWQWFYIANTMVSTPDKPLPLGKLIEKKAKYIGELEDNKPHGYGIRYYNVERTRVYEGTFERGDRVWGKCVYNNGDEYVGEWKDDCRTGYGTYTWVIGDCHIGEWLNGNLHGLGEYFWQDGRHYRGEWAEHNHHGNGVYQWPDGSNYRGDWKTGKRHGYGTMNWAGGESWEGQWHEDFRMEMDEALKLIVAQDEHNLPKRWDGYFRLSFGEQRKRIVLFREEQSRKKIDTWIEKNTFGPTKYAKNRINPTESK